MHIYIDDKLSNTSALTRFADEDLLHMETGELCGAVLLDLTKAFDIVDHDILRCRLLVFRPVPCSGSSHT